VTEVRTEGASRLLPIAVDSILLVGLLVTTLGHSGAPVSSELLANTLSHPSNDASAVDLAIDPPSYEMRTGSNLTVQAVWSAGTPLCRVTALWYRWSVDNGSATGFLNASIGPSATFTAESFGSGTVPVSVRSGAVLDCSGNETVVGRSNRTSISIVVPLSLSGVDVGPNPMAPGNTAVLEGTVTGGELPYTVEVTWGDGAHSTVAVPASGPFSVGHPFSAGEFVPFVVANDVGGSFVNVSVAEALSVGTGLEVAITPASYVAVVGVPAEFTGVAESKPAGAVTLFDCSNATVGPDPTSPASPNATPFSCTFIAPGTQEVLFGAYPPQPGGTSASIVLYENVVTAPQLSATPVESVGEEGSTALVQVHLSGGALPISLTWNLSGNRSGGAETVGSDGSGVLRVPLGVAGEYTLGVRASDALGDMGTSVTATVWVDPPLDANVTGARSLVSYGAVAEVAGEVLSGCPPFSWWVVPDLAPANGSPGNGTLPDVGAFSWNGSYDQEGNLSLTAGAADGCGATWRTGLEVPLIPILSAEVAVASGPTSPNETLAVNLSVQGGQSPFQLYVNASDNESWNRTLPSDGTYRWLFPAHANGSLEVLVSVTDRLGKDLETHLTVALIAPAEPTVPPPPPSTLPGPFGNSTTTAPMDPTWLLLALIPAGGIATVVFLRGRRARKTRGETPGPDPVETLKRIIEPAEGAERFTVELLAEEAGIPLAVVRSTIDRLVSEGAIRSESGADGEEVLSWSSEAGR